MAQYRKDQHIFLPNGNTIFEVAMSASEDGRLYANNNPTPSASMPYLWQMEKGNVTGVTAVNVQGFNSNHPSAWRAVWELSNTSEFLFPSTDLAMAFTSSATETLTMTVSGLDSNYDIKIAIVTFTASTTGVVTSGTNSFFRINRITITSGTSVGNISVTNNGSTYGYVAIGNGISQATVYTVPAGYTFFLNRVNAYSTNNGTQHCFFRVWLRRYVNGISTEQIVLTAPFTQSYASLRVVPRAYSEKTDIKWQLNQSNPAEGSIQLEGILVRNTII